MGALLPRVGVSLEELVILLHSLHNLISSSAHSGVVQGHVEFLLGFLEGDLVMRSL